MQLIRTFSFEAAHTHPVADATTPQLHGHRFWVTVTVSGQKDPNAGWLVDFSAIKEATEPVLALLDHRFLNDIVGLDQACQVNVADWIKRHISEIFPYEIDVLVECREHPQMDLDYFPADHRRGHLGGVGISFESAHYLPRTPQGHKCRRLHGHSYRLEIEDPDQLLGEQHLLPLFNLVDHRFLNEIEGLENPTAEELCGFFWKGLLAEGFQPTVVRLYETPVSACVYRGG